ncbi:MAG: hypothetical protein AAFV77_11500 [Planctomycetota bacterium]
MKTQSLIDRLDAHERQRQRDLLMAAAGHAVASGRAWAPGLARELQVNLPTANELLDELIRREVCNVRYTASTTAHNVTDSYPVTSDFFERCRASGLDLSNRSGTDALDHATRIATSVLSAQE